MAGDRPCFMLLAEERGEAPSVAQIRSILEKGSEDDKIEVLKTVITQMLHGEDMSSLLMSIIRFVLPSRNHTIKKLLLFFFEIVEKTNGVDASGKPQIIPEFILCGNAWQQDLNHPNEYVRGATLRFVCKLREEDLLEPLVPSMRTCLEHRHSYVRRNAVLAIYSTFANFPDLIPDAPEVVYNYLLGEADDTCKRNAFIMLQNCSPELTIQYLEETADEVASCGSALQLALVEVVKKLYRSNTAARPLFLRVIFELLTAEVPSVQYEAATTLINMTTSSTAIKACAGTYIELVVNQSDNNVKLIVLDRLADLKATYPKVMQELVMDVLRALGRSSDMDIRRKTLDIAIDLITPRNIDEVVAVLKKEITKTQGDGEGDDKAGEYCQLLIQTIHTCAVRFPEVAANVVLLLMDFLSADNAGSAGDVMVFVREVAMKYENLRPSIVRKVLQMFGDISSSTVFRGALWIIGEFCEGGQELSEAFKVINSTLGSIPFLQEGDGEDGDGAHSSASASADASGAGPSAPLLNADGTYATQTAVGASAAAAKGKVADTLSAESMYPIRTLLFKGDFYLGSALATCLTKLALKSQRFIQDKGRRNGLTAEILLILTSMLRLGASDKVEAQIAVDCSQRIMLCLRVLADPSPALEQVFLARSRQAFALLLEETERRKEEARSAEDVEVEVEADDVIRIRQLRGAAADLPFGDEDDVDLVRATGALERTGDATLQLDKVYPLTGFSDPVYAEAYVNVHQYDITLDVLIVNQRADTLQNLSLELATLGDLKLVEKPTSYTLGPHAFINVRANIKVSSTETGIVFGNIVYDVAGASANDKNFVVLNDIHIDIMDYIAPATCTEDKFRQMWAEFEWENKVSINAPFADVSAFLTHLLKSTNMKCLTPEWALDGDAGFLAANLYARSIFGEDALANVSVEMRGENKVGGFIRIRGKTRGIALSLGDKITLLQSGDGSVAASSRAAEESGADAE